MVGADGDGLSPAAPAPEADPPALPAMRTPRAAATSRADGVTMVPIGTRSSPPAGTSCAVITRFMQSKPAVQFVRTIVMKRHLSLPSFSASADALGPSHGQLQRQPLQPHRGHRHGREHSLRARPGRDPHLRVAAAMEAGRGQPPEALEPTGRRTGARVGAGTSQFVVDGQRRPAALRARRGWRSTKARAACR